MWHHTYEEPFYFPWCIRILLLTACGGSKYDNSIDEVKSSRRKARTEMRADSDEDKKDNAEFV